MKPDEDITPAEVQEHRRILGAMTPAHRRMVRRLVKVLSLAIESPRAPRRPRIAPVEPIEPVSPEACDDDPADDLTRADARRILARHGRGTGGAA